MARNFELVSFVMKIFDANIACPTCSGPMLASELKCAPCGTSVRGNFRGNEFQTLTPEMLQFLRLFVMHEGRIRDLEKSLGISYPSVKSKIADLKSALQLTNDDSIAASEEDRDPIESTLDELESGAIDVEAAIAKIKKR